MLCMNICNSVHTITMFITISIIIMSCIRSVPKTRCPENCQSPY